MPEAPDLQVVKEFLQRTLTGVAVTQARVLKPIVLRSLAAEDFTKDITGRAFTGFWRKGKLLGLELAEQALPPLHVRGEGEEPTLSLPKGVRREARLLVINPMLSGGLQYCDPKERVSAKTFIILSLGNGRDLRYFDDDQMGMVYYLRPEQLQAVPRLMEQGPDVLDAPLSLDEFKAHLKPFRGEIKGVLTRGALVSGVGNAYGDEICFAAGLFPFRKLSSLSPQEVERLWRATYEAPKAAVPVLRQRVGEDIHHKVRDFLQIHGKGGQACPKCGRRITEIRANGRLHNYCRQCQPGSLIGSFARPARPDLAQGSDAHR
jgi:formamidopyrimidine-DNA glycosylase